MEGQRDIGRERLGPKVIQGGEGWPTKERRKRKMEGCLLESTVWNLTRAAIMKEREEKPVQRIEEWKDSGESGGRQQGRSFCTESGP